MRKDHVALGKKSLLYRHTVIAALTVMSFLFLVIAFWTKLRFREYERQKMDAENLLLIQMMDKAENDIGDLKKIAEQMMLDNTITPWRLKNAGFYAVTALEKLAYYCQGTDAFDDLLICLNQDTEIYRIGGREYFSTLSEKTFLLKGALTAEKLYELLNSKASFDFPDLSEQCYLNDKRKGMITYPLQSAYGETWGTLTGLFSMDYFTEMLQTTDLVSDTMICSTNGKILFSTDARMEITPELMEILKNSRDEKYFYDLELQGKEYHAVVHHSDMTQWCYIRLINARELAIKQRSQLLPMTCLLLLLSLLVSAGLGMVLGFYYYTPMRNILHLLNPNLSYNAKKNELSLINSYIRNLQMENSYSKQQLKAKERQQLKWIFTDMLYGKNAPWKVDLEFLEQYGFREQVCEFCIVLLILQDEQAEEDFECRLEKTVSEDVFFITKESDRKYFCLYSSEKKGIARVRIEEFHQRLKDEGYQLRVAMGQCKTDFDKLKDSLYESLLAAELDTDRAVSCLEHSHEQTIQDCWKPGKEELLLDLTMRNGNKDDVLKQSLKLEKELSVITRYWSSNEIQFIFCRIINYVVRYAEKMETKENIEELLAKMLRQRTIKEFFVTFRSSIEQLYRENTVSDSMANNSRMQELKDFVDENFCLPQMSLRYMADHFSLSDTYLSKLFKENFGENFIDYLLRKRMEEAARLLAETDMSVKQIVKSVGYEDVSSFSKKFSAKFEMTPGKYRKQLRIEK